jgi:hypothetical protein
LAFEEGLHQPGVENCTSEGRREHALWRWCVGVSIRFIIADSSVIPSFFVIQGLCPCNTLLCTREVLITSYISPPHLPQSPLHSSTSITCHLNNEILLAIHSIPSSQPLDSFPLTRRYPPILQVPWIRPVALSQLVHPSEVNAVAVVFGSVVRSREGGAQHNAGRRR